MKQQFDKNEDGQYYEEDDGDIKENVFTGDAEDKGLGDNDEFEERKNKELKVKFVKVENYV